MKVKFDLLYPRDSEHHDAWGDLWWCDQQAAITFWNPTLTAMQWLRGWLK